MTETERDLAILPIRKKRRVWWQFMRKYNCQSICEVGVGDGANFFNMIAHGPSIAVAVDTWRVPSGQKRNAGGLTQERLNGQYWVFVAEAFERPCVRECRMPSLEAAPLWADGQFDLIYIDANHAYEGCKADIEAWYPKVRSGGFLLGDDYRVCTWPSGTVCGVIEAVNEFAARQGLRVIEMPRYGWGIVKP